MARQKTRVWATIPGDILERLDELGELRGEKRGQTVERMITAECEKTENALTIELSVDVLEEVKSMAIAQKRTVEAQISWVIEQFLRLEKTNECKSTTQH